MGCLSHRRKQPTHFSDQKWDYIHLDDFKSKGCGSIFAYGFLWFSLILSAAVYVVDTFTAVQLLAFNRWSSEIEPAISFAVSKWIFSVCIILSFVNLGFEGIRACRVSRRGNIAECYLDSLAVRWESIRLGRGQGWRRFLVFAELTKSKKGAHYIALFTYFSFQAWIRVIFCTGPRQVVNALTLRSVYMAKLAVSSQTVEGSITSFFEKLELLAEQDLRQAVILSGMLFTLVIWVFSVLYLILAVCFYVFFLCHWIPRSDGGLSGYCVQRVNKALLKIVTKHVNKALAKGHADRVKAAKAAAAWCGKNTTVSDPLRTAAPTLPNLEKSSTLPPAYTSRPTTPGKNAGPGINSAGIKNSGVNSSNWQELLYSRSRTLATQANYPPRMPQAIRTAIEIGSVANPVGHQVQRPPPTARSNTTDYQRQNRFPIRSNTTHHFQRPFPVQSNTMEHFIRAPAPTRSSTIGAHGDDSGSRWRASRYPDGFTQSPTVLDTEPTLDAAPPYSPRASLDLYAAPQVGVSTTGQEAWPMPDLGPPQRTLTAPMPSRTRTMTDDQDLPERGYSQRSQRSQMLTRRPTGPYDGYPDSYDVEAQPRRA